MAPIRIDEDSVPASFAAPSKPSTLSSHPLDQLTPSEILLTSDVARKWVAEETEIKAVRFISATLCEPPKLDVLAFLGITTEPNKVVSPDLAVVIARKVDVTIIDEISGSAYDLLVHLTSPTSGSVVSSEKLPTGVQPSLTVDELMIAEETIRADPLVQKLAAEVGLTPEQLYCDGWSIGIDPRFPQSQRIQQCLVYARLSEHENLYAHPCDFWPIIDNNTKKVLTVEFAPKRLKNGKLSSGTTVPPSLESLKGDAACQDVFGRERIPPPMTPFDFLPELMAQNDPEFKLRTDLKPINITQPEGVSFKVNGNAIEWQKWNVHVAFHAREGLVLNTVTYNDGGKVRPVVYRMGLAEMVVPYASPDSINARKFAFDVGEYGLGILANDLTLGCDCKGTIHYMPGSFITNAGTVETIDKAICIHEEDAGLAFKHSDYRKGGRGHSVRQRKLVISSIHTIANYEYAVYYNFYIDGTIELEIKLTGILNLNILAEGEQTHGFGTQVAPRIMAHHHQHIFSLRVDPMIDGLKNTVVETEVLPMEEETGSAENWAGNGFRAVKTYLNSTSEGPRTYNNDRQRSWSIVNESKTHYASGEPVGYKIMCKDHPPLLPSRTSHVATRAPFALSTLQYAPYSPTQIYPAGKHVPQTRETPKDSVLEWMKGDKDVRDKDVVVWISFGVTHVPRPEDFPVMPVEQCRLALKPIGFFKYNPALDVPGTTDVHSSLAFGDVRSSASSISSTGGAGDCCA